MMHNHNITPNHPTAPHKTSRNPPNSLAAMPPLSHIPHLVEMLPPHLPPHHDDVTHSLPGRDAATPATCCWTPPPSARGTRQGSEPPERIPQWSCSWGRSPGPGEERGVTEELQELQRNEIVKRARALQSTHKCTLLLASNHRSTCPGPTQAQPTHPKHVEVRRNGHVEVSWAVLHDPLLGPHAVLQVLDHADGLLGAIPLDQEGHLVHNL